MGLLVPTCVTPGRQRCFRNPGKHRRRIRRSRERSQLAWGEGDEWDAQNDMLAAFVGAVIMMSIVALTDRKKCGNER